MTKFFNISTDTSLGGNSPSDSTVCSQKAIKNYIDTHSGGSVSSVNGKTGAVVLNPSDIGVLPDYSSGVSLSNNTDYTCLKDGIILACGYSGNSASSVAYKNGVEFLRGIYTVSAYIFTPFYFPVHQGDIIKINMTGGVVGTGIMFYPLQGA